ncbi:MAG: helix-turn-helix domain-containing protein [Eubacteriales bacterium]|nr:helix-turn-helix domain-containing protein [Eubacteriales bacterium]
MNNHQIARMRYPEQALRELKKDDPNSQVSLNFIRALARRGDIPCFRVGRGYLLNYDALLDYLANAPFSVKQSTGLRKISE